MGCAPSRQKEQDFGAGGGNITSQFPGSTAPKTHADATGEDTGEDKPRNGFPVHEKPKIIETTGLKESTDNTAVTAENWTKDKSTTLTILHFNDVYNIEPRDKEPVGGVARFAHKLASYKHLNPFIVFSGDVLNPSMISSVTKGKHMVPVLNALNINIAVYGNHDFDFGVDALIEFNEATNFPWLMSNVMDKISDDTLAEGEITRIIEWGGRKIGCIGLVEEEWLVTLATVDPSDLNYLDFVEQGTKLAKQLREQGAEFVIALTHMRIPNDCRLAEHATGIDLILGGHDHHYEVKQVNGVHIVKSGSDFRQFSRITVEFSDDNNYAIDVERIDITSEVPEDPELKAIVDQYMDIMKESMEEKLGEIEVELDGRFSSLRTQETNLGNFVADIMHNVSKADVVLLNSGTLRSDALHPPGEFKKKDLVSILPMPDSVVVIELTGAQVLRALENGVSQWPKHEGRFPQVSGIHFTFNPKLDPGSRVIHDGVTVAGQPLQKDKVYKVCTKGYIAKGKDGYDVLTEGKLLLDEESGPILPTIVQNHFDSINIVKGVKLSRSRHRQSIVMRLDGRSSASLLDSEMKHVKINPQVEGRITIIKEDEPLVTDDSLEGPAVLVMTETTTYNGSTDNETTSTKAADGEEHQPNVENTGDSQTNDDNSPIENQQPDTTVLVKSKDEIETDKEKGKSIGQTDTKEQEPDLASEDDYWDLWEAVKTDDIDTVKKLHEDKHIRLERFQDNKTILHLGAERNSTKVVEYLLLDGKVNPNSLDEILQGVPLHGAAEFGSIDAANILLQNGAKINKQDLLGNTAFHVACEHGQSEFKSFLVEQGADTTIENTDGEKMGL